MMKKRFLKGLGTLTLVMLLGACSSIAAKLKPSKQVAQPRTDAEGSIQVGNLTRIYDLHVPSSYNSQKAVPLVLVFHGASSDGKAMEQMTGFSRLAEQEGFIAVYPDAINQHWDARRRNMPETTNDVGFISALIDKLDEKYNIDRQRIYATGFSNGGMFTQRVACELSDKVAAVSIVAATMPENLSQTCQPTKPVPVLLMHGTNDALIPYGPPGKALLSLADTVKFWSNHNQCSADRQSKSLPDVAQVRLETYQNCANKTDVMLYTIEGGGHSWAGADAAETTGSSQQMDATEVIWDFFSKHSARLEQS